MRLNEQYLAAPLQSEGQLSIGNAKFESQSPPNHKIHQNQLIMKKILLLALGLSIANAQVAQAQTATIVYQQDWGASNAPNSTLLPDLGWSANFAPVGSSGTWSNEAALVDVDSGETLPPNTIWFGGNSAGIGAFYTFAGAGSGTYGNSSFTSIDPTVHTNLEISVECNWGWQGELTTDYVAVNVGGSWYVSTNHPLVPPVNSGNPLYYKVGMFYSPNATNWNALTLADPVVIGAPAGANLSGTIDGVGIVSVITGSSWWNYNVLRISSIDTNEPPPWAVGPLSATNYAGAGVSFGVKSVSALPLYYQWYSNGVALVNGGRISGATNSVLTITNVTTADSGTSFSAIVSNAVGAFDTSTNSPATLTVNPLPADVLYAELLPYVGPTAAGGPVSLVGWSNSIPDYPDRLSPRSGSDGVVWIYEGYAWNSAFYATTDSDTGRSGVPFPSINPEAHPAISFSADIAPIWQAVNVVSYFAVQMGGANWYISQSPLPVSTIDGSGYVTYQQPFSRSAIQWNELTLNDSGAIIGAQPSSDLVGDITGAGLVFVNTAAGGVNFDNFQISTTEVGLIAPFMLYPPIPQTVYVGGGASFAVKTGGSQPLSYYWQVNGSPLSDGGRFSGTKSNMMTIVDVAPGDQAVYSVIVSNAAGTVDSSIYVTSGLLVNTVPADLLYAETFPYVGPLPPGATYPLSAVGWGNSIPASPNRLFALDYAGDGAGYAYESTPQATAFYTTTAMDTGASGLAFQTVGLAGASGLTFAVDIAPAVQASNVTAYVAVQINGATWYVASTALPVDTSVDSDTYSTVSQVFSPAAANWKNLTLSGTGATIGGVAGADLSGNITGAGLVIVHTGSGGTFNFDNFQFTGTGGTVVINPGSISLGPITSTTITMNWTANANVRLQSTTDLASGLWQDVPNTAGQSTYTATTTGPQMFYRLIGQ